MLPSKEQVINKLQEAKQLYGVNYSTLAKEIGITPVAITNFIHNKGRMSIEKQLQAVCAAEKRIQGIKEQLQILDHKGVCINEK